MWMTMTEITCLYDVSVTGAVPRPLCRYHSGLSFNAIETAIMSKPDKRGLPRIIDAFGYSMKGLSAAWKYEESFRQELILAVLLLPLACWLARTPVELILLVGVLFGVLIAELTNSAIEAVVDRTGLERHELSGRAKDIGSAMVFLSMVLAGMVWIIIAVSRFFG